MKSFLRAFGLLTFFSSEVLLYLVGSYYAGAYLDSTWPMSTGWLIVTLPFSLLLCLWSGYRFFGRLIKMEAAKSKEGL